MATISYAHQFSYTYNLAGEPFPVLVLRIADPRNHEQAVEVDCYLDSGAQRSLFDGGIARAIGLDLFGGRPVTYTSAANTRIGGWLHAVELSHPDLGRFNLDVGFSTVQVSRNLLGRDFFDLNQIGFRERQLVFYVTPSP